MLGSHENRTPVTGAEIGSFAKGSRRELVTWAPKVGLDLRGSLTGLCFCLLMGWTTCGKPSSFRSPPHPFQAALRQERVLSQ